MKFQQFVKTLPDVVKEIPEIAEKYLALAKHFPQLGLSREDMLGWVGVPQPRSVLLPTVVAFGSGVVVGAAAALVLAPSSGAELRRELVERLRNSRQRSESPMEPEHEPSESNTSPPNAPEPHTGHA